MGGVRLCRRSLAACTGLVLLPRSAWGVALKLDILPDVLGQASPRLVGFGIEDVNHELYGGIYSQMVYGEDFEEPAGPTGVSGDAVDAVQRGFSPTWSALAPGRWRRHDQQGPAGPSYETLSSGVFNGKQSQLMMAADGEAQLLNRGLYQQGMYLRADSDYEGYLFARLVQSGAGSSLPTLRVSLVASRTGVWAEPMADYDTLSSVAFSVNSTNWTRLDFRLSGGAGARCRVVSGPAACSAAAPQVHVRTKEGECVLCAGGLVLAVSGGAVAVDFVFLQPGPWGRFRDLPVRQDVATSLQDLGVNVLRLGGSACNVPGWRWKNMRGPREHRQPYEGLWHPFTSQGWRLLEFLALCEELEVQAVVTLNNEETPEDLADLVEYAYGAANTTWGRQRVVDGHVAPYAPFIVEIGNEQPLDDNLVRQVPLAAEAMRARAGVIGFDPQRLRFAIGHNLGQAEIGTPICDAMVIATKFIGDKIMWDLHVDGTAPTEVTAWEATLAGAQGMLDRLGSQMQLAVFEENSWDNHDLLRGLNRARYANVYERMAGRFTIGTAANGLQVFGLNDNGWDQGAIFMAPDRVWLSPFGYVDYMISRADELLILRTQLNDTSLAQLDVGAGRAEDLSAFSLRVVNYDTDRPADLLVTLPQGVSCETATVTTLQAPVGFNASAVNPPSDPTRVAPMVEKVREVGELRVVPLSFATVRWSGCRAASDHVRALYG